MAKLLYSIHLSRHIDGFGKPCVGNIPSSGVTFNVDPEGNKVMPDINAIRECLPHYYRKAFDRRDGNWQDNNSHYWTFYLRGSRGKHLNVIYAYPYEFDVKNKKE